MITSQLAPGDVDDFDPTPEYRFLLWARTRGNVLLTGQAGTGKSTLLRQFLQDTPLRVAVTAPTGIEIGRAHV